MWTIVDKATSSSQEQAPVRQWLKIRPHDHSQVLPHPFTIRLRWKLSQEVRMAAGAASQALRQSPEFINTPAASQTMKPTDDVENSAMNCEFRFVSQIQRPTNKTKSLRLY
jgi:hypothetical protein